MAKSRILKELRSKGIPKFIKSIEGDLDLLTKLYYGKPVTTTFVDVLIMEAFKKYPLGKFDFLFHSSELQKIPQFESVQKEFDFAFADATMFWDKTQKGTIYRLLHDQLELATFYGTKYLTQKEIMGKTKLSKGTISKLLKELVDKGVVERDSSSSTLKYCCKRIYMEKT